MILIIFQYRSESTCMNTCVSSPELVWPGLYFSGLRPNPRQICWTSTLSGVELSPSTSVRPETDRAVRNAIEQLGLGACVALWPPSPFFSVILSLRACFPFAHSASIPQLPRVTSLLLFPPLLRLLLSFAFFPPPSSPLDLDVKASQAVWSLSAGCQGRDTAHWDPEWDKLTVTMFPLSMWSWEKEKVKRRAR